MKFKLVGVVNILNIIPDFIYPIFESDQNDGKYYFLCNNKGGETIQDVDELREDWVERIMFFPNISKNDFEPSDITVGSKLIFAFQKSDSEVYVGYYNEVREYLLDFTCEYEVINRYVKNFCERML